MTAGLEYLHTLVYLCPLLFLAGFIDSSAGGGGTVSLPAYMLTGMPAHMAFGTNKLSMSLGTAIAAGRFIKNKAADLRAAVISALLALAGAAIGSRLALSMDDGSFRLLLLVALPCVAVFLAVRKKPGEADRSVPGPRPVRGFIPKRVILAGAIGFFIGMYDGIIGPGTGTFAIIAYNTFMKYDLRTASGNAKVINLASNVASLATFALAGSVYYIIGLPAAVFCVAGNYAGSGFAIKKGARFIRPMLFVVLALLFAKIAYDILI